MKACAPGKLILSGEHSAVYGAPAIALAVNRYIRCEAEYSSFAGLTLNLPDADWQAQMSWSDLRYLNEHLDQRFQLFEQGHIGAAHILEAPHQLALYAVSQCLPETEPDTGLSLDIRSDLPLGSGMGSSAALSAAVTCLTQKLFATSLDTANLFQRVRYCERLCHGRGGLIDGATVTHGGLIEVDAGQITPLPVTLGDGWYYIHSGVPAVGTGECVDNVRRRFADSSIWQDFSGLTAQLKAAIVSGTDPRVLIRENHRLLTKIGVVPEPVQRFIQQLENLGGAAKVSGAGAVAGEFGGALIAYLPNIELSEWCRQAGYRYMAIEEDKQGARLED
ncbi:mevalonate kinase [Amphritea sp. 1_MG-2023]|uniref:mevalonate kinase family protein n=1 Tax=Amphritea sp. 1_MG-2023 TaxID=3062670 RepID=UPI0026E3E0AA|nr:mevalonate kinase [Amphritea sp. 1_MG-2023]MDO6564129.1 mevalonate kinase [Amphritea sp. 1_MG-2023]